MLDPISYWGSEAFSPAVALPALFGVWGVVTSINLYVGASQARLAGASRRRLLVAAAGLAALDLLPAMVLVLFGSAGARRYDMLVVAAVSTSLNALIGFRFLDTPIRFQQTTRTLPRVTDERLLARIESLANRMGVQVPIAWRWPSLTSDMPANAVVGTLQAPQIVVTDGTQHRLSSAECDAILAHELGHIANGSLWLLASVIPVGGAVATAIAAMSPAWFAGAFGLAFTVGLRRLVSRPIEFDCDRRAAEVAGFRETIAALAKIHAVHPVGNSGLMSHLFYATATHPSRDERLKALHDAAPADDRPEIAPEGAVVRLRRRSSRIAFLIWITVLAGALTIAVTGNAEPWLAVPLLIVGLTPLGLLLLAIRRASAVVRRRLGRRWPRPVWVVAALCVVVPVAIVVVGTRGDPGLRDPDEFDPMGISSLFVTVMAGGIVLYLAGTDRQRKLLQKVRVALQVHDFRGAVKLCASDPRTVRRSHLLRHNEALARAICGQRASAIEALEQLRKDHPRFPLAAMVLTELLLDADQPDRAVEIARDVAAALPDDPAVLLLEARALRRLGRIDAAREACERARALEPDAAVILAVAAGLALDEGKTDEARRLIAEAEARSPGGTVVRVVQADWPFMKHHLTRPVRRWLKRSNRFAPTHSASSTSRSPASKRCSIDVFPRSAGERRSSRTTSS